MDNALSGNIKNIVSIGQVTLISVAKKVTFENLPDIQREFAQATKNRNVKNIIFDLKDISETDTSGIAALVDLLKYMKIHHIKGRIGLINLSKKIKSLLVISKVEEIFKEYASEIEAIEELK